MYIFSLIFFYNFRYAKETLKIIINNINFFHTKYNIKINCMSNIRHNTIRTLKLKKNYMLQMTIMK